MKTEHAADKAQGEWNAEIVHRISELIVDETFDFYSAFKKIADAHNASITAEREENKVSWRRVVALEQQLAARDAFAKRVERQLPAAQLAIKKHNHDSCHYMGWKRIDYTDTAALDAAIAKAQQPLVDALKEIAHCFADTDKWTCVSIARAALAKVKDGK